VERTNERRLFASEQICQWLATREGHNPSKLATNKENNEQQTMTNQIDRERKRRNEINC